jgi:uncharacterized OB-fold protein
MSSSSTRVCTRCGCLEIDGAPYCDRCNAATIEWHTAADRCGVATLRELLNITPAVRVHHFEMRRSEIVARGRAGPG